MGIVNSIVEGASGRVANHSYETWNVDTWKGVVEGDATAGGGALGYFAVKYLNAA